MTTTAKVIIGMTVAAAAGAAIGILLAPEKGTDLQKKIKDVVQEWLHEFSGLVNTGKELASNLKLKAGQQVDELTSELIDTSDTRPTS